MQRAIGSTYVTGGGLTTLGACRGGEARVGKSLMVTLGAGGAIGGGSVKVGGLSVKVGGWSVAGINCGERRDMALTGVGCNRGEREDTASIGAEGVVVSAGFAGFASCVGNHRWQAARKSLMARSCASHRAVGTFARAPVRFCRPCRIRLSGVTVGMVRCSWRYSTVSETQTARESLAMTLSQR